MINHKRVRFIPWLAWLGLLILATGGSLAYLLHTQNGDPDIEHAIRITLVVTIVSAGVCLISATADWWINR